MTRPTFDTYMSMPVGTLAEQPAEVLFQLKNLGDRFARSCQSKCGQRRLCSIAQIRGPSTSTALGCCQRCQCRALR